MGCPQTLRFGGLSRILGDSVNVMESERLIPSERWICGDYQFDPCLLTGSIICTIGHSISGKVRVIILSSGRPSSLIDYNTYRTASTTYRNYPSWHVTVIFTTQVSYLVRFLSCLPLIWLSNWLGYVWPMFMLIVLHGIAIYGIGKALLS